MRHPKPVPSFALYGEPKADAARTDVLHIEDIPSRSRKYLWKIASHRHAGQSQCVYVTAGSATVELEETRREVKGPALIVVPAGTVHGFRFRADSQGYVLTVDLKRVFGFAATAQQAPIDTLFSAPRIIEFTPALTARLDPLFQRLLAEFREPDSLGAPLVAWLGCAILWLLATAAQGAWQSAPASGHDLERLRAFRFLLEEKYLRHWPVSRYARQLNLSETSLNRVCRRLTGSTAFDLIQERLALEARRRLCYVAGSVATIGQELGFADPAYFCRFFRRHNGLSPSAFRRRQDGAAQFGTARDGPVGSEAASRIEVPDAAGH
jgi:AraC family transcriptional activator of pobA